MARMKAGSHMMLASFMYQDALLICRVCLYIGSFALWGDADSNGMKIERDKTMRLYGTPFL